MKLKTQINFKGNNEKGSALNWYIELFRIDDNVWIHCIDVETDKIIFEIELAEWEKTGKAVRIMNEVELRVEALE